MNAPLKLAPAPTQFDKLPPHDIEAEQALIGSMFLAAVDKPDVLAEILIRSDVDDFFLPEHKTIAQVMADLRTADKPIDAITLPAELRRRGLLDDIGGAAYLAQCMHAVPSVAAGPYYAKIVHEHAQLRRIIFGLNDVVARAYEPAYDGECLSDALIQTTNQTLESLTAKVTEDSVTFADAIEQTLIELENGGVTQVPTGFRDIDAAFGGLGEGENIVVAARPSMGKSLFCRQMGVNIAIRGDAVAIIAAEESRFFAEGVPRYLPRHLRRRGVQAAGHLPRRRSR